MRHCLELFTEYLCRLCSPEQLLKLEQEEEQSHCCRASKSAVFYFFSDEISANRSEDGAGRIQGEQREALEGRKR